MIVCAALIGQQNQPLYLRAFPTAAEGEQLVKLHYIVHCSLDAIEEKVLQKRTVADNPSPYLGLLYPIQELKVYGYLTNTGIKVVLVLDDVTAKDDTVSRVLRRIHHAYVDVASNPFFTFGAPLQSSKFDHAVEAAVAGFGKP